MTKSIAPPDVAMIQDEGSDSINLRAIAIEWENDIERQAFQDWFQEQGYELFAAWYERNKHLIGGP
jgi:hypothetical protein